jgi:hypothetical protein
VIVAVAPFDVTMALPLDMFVKFGVATPTGASSRVFPPTTLNDVDPKASIVVPLAVSIKGRASVPPPPSGGMLSQRPDKMRPVSGSALLPPDVPAATEKTPF